MLKKECRRTHLDFAIVLALKNPPDLKQLLIDFLICFQYYKYKLYTFKNNATKG